MSEPNTFIDGCGLFPDTPIGENTRIRFRLAEDRQQDISIRLEDGILHIYGMYRPLAFLVLDDNHIAIDTKVWPRGKVLRNDDGCWRFGPDMQLPLRPTSVTTIDGRSDQEGLSA